MTETDMVRPTYTHTHTHISEISVASAIVFTVQNQLLICFIWIIHFYTTYRCNIQEERISIEKMIRGEFVILDFNFREYKNISNCTDTLCFNK